MFAAGAGQGRHARSREHNEKSSNSSEMVKAATATTTTVRGSLGHNAVSESDPLMLWTLEVLSSHSACCTSTRRLTWQALILPS